MWTLAQWLNSAAEFSPSVSCVWCPLIINSTTTPALQSIFPHRAAGKQAQGRLLCSAQQSKASFPLGSPWAAPASSRMWEWGPVLKVAGWTFFCKCLSKAKCRGERRGRDKTQLNSKMTAAGKEKAAFSGWCWHKQTIFSPFWLNFSLLT